MKKLITILLLSFYLFISLGYHLIEISHELLHLIPDNIFHHHESDHQHPHNQHHTITEHHQVFEVLQQEEQKKADDTAVPDDYKLIYFFLFWQAKENFSQVNLIQKSWVFNPHFFQSPYQHFLSLASPPPEIVAQYIA